MDKKVLVVYSSGLALMPAFNAGCIKWNGKYVVIARVEGLDRKSSFAVTH